jgi:arginase
MTIALLGFAWDASSSYARGPALAPALIRSMLWSEASSPNAIDGTSAKPLITAYDFPEMPDDSAAARDVIEATVQAHLASERKTISLGGDHSITYPILRAIKARHGAVNVLHVDAHMDMYEELNGDRYSHACPFARALDDGCIAQLVQVGIRSRSPEQLARAQRFGVVSLGSEDLDRIPAAFFKKPLYLSIDIDGLDPAFAPGVSHPEPGGLSTREVLALIARIEGDILGADIVEVNPERDHNLQTAAIAVRLVKELAVRMA